MNGGTTCSNAARGRWAVVTALGTSTTLAWASSYYLPAILADSIASGTGVSVTWVFAAFSASLLIAALVGPFVGRAIDRRGGRGVLALSNVVLATGLVSLALATGPVGLFGAWAILGVGMALGLYDAGFAALTAIYGDEARGPVTGITLFAGFSVDVKLASFDFSKRCVRLARDVFGVGSPKSLDWSSVKPLCFTGKGPSRVPSRSRWGN